MTESESTTVNVGQPATASSNVFKMVPNTTRDNSVSEDIEKLIEMVAPAGTDNYSAAQLLCVPVALKSKHDFETGNKRNPKWGMVFSFSIVPELHRNPIGPMMLPSTPSQFITSDSLESIKERIIFELDRAIGLAKIAERDPDAYQAYEEAVIKRATAHLHDDDGC